jgi:hypothetical protein
VQAGIQQPPAKLNLDADDEQTRRFVEEARKMVETGRGPGEATR